MTIDPLPATLLSSPDLLSGFESLRLRFAQVPDPRMAGRVRHRIDEVLMVAFCSMLSDNDAFTDMAAFAKSQLAWLRTFLPLVHGAPSHDIFRNVFMAIQPGSLLLIMKDWCGDLAGQKIHIDGKALRGSDSAAAGLSMVHLLRAWVQSAGISAGHEVCAEKSNEIDALPRLLRSLHLTGSTITIDAMGTHPDIAAQIHRAGGHYLLALKKNQPGAYAAVHQHFEQMDAGMENTGSLPPSHEKDLTLEFSHGRYEHRECIVTGELDWFLKSWKWEGLGSVVRVVRTTHRGGKREALTREVHYYLTSKDPSAPTLAGLIRQHWSVENTCHYVLDVTFGEDDCQVRDRIAAQNLSVMREMTGKVIRDYLPRKSIRSKRKLAAMDSAFRKCLLGSIVHNFNT
jgi:predicted transposase YbfD/YdcC